MRYRKERISELIHGVITSGIRELHDEFSSLISLTSVELTPDLKLAKIYWTFPEQQLGETVENLALPKEERSKEKRIEEINQALVEARNSFKRLIADQLKLKHTPQLEFYYDRSFETGSRIDALLKKAGL